jgi:cobyrinic acid a,c-diamide synthase
MLSYTGTGNYYNSNLINVGLKNKQQSKNHISKMKKNQVFKLCLHVLGVVDFHPKKCIKSKYTGLIFWRSKAEVTILTLKRSS